MSDWRCSAVIRRVRAGSFCRRGSRQSRFLAQSGWFLAGSSQGLAGTNPSGNFGTGLNLVLIGQFTVMGGGARVSDIVDIRTDGSLGDGGGVFTGGLNIGINDQTNPSIQGVQFIPTPGAVALFGLAGLTAARRRRG